MIRSDSADFDQRVGDALRGVSAPEAVVQQTLAAIEAMRPGSEERALATVHSPTTTALQVPEPAAASALQKPGAPLATRTLRRRRWRGALAAAACLLVAVLGFASYQLYQQPAAYVGIDVNPSIELAVNGFDRVVSAAAVNEDGQAVLDQLSLTGKPFEQALNDLIGSTAMAAYLDEDAFVDVSITTDDDALASQLQSQSDAVLQSHAHQGECHRADAATREAAFAAGMGVGRYSAAQELMDLDESVTLDECDHMTMGELHAAIGELCSEEGHHHRYGQSSNTRSETAGESTESDLPPADTSHAPEENESGIQPDSQPSTEDEPRPQDRPNNGAQRSHGSGSHNGHGNQHHPE